MQESQKNKESGFIYWIQQRQKCQWPYHNNDYGSECGGGGGGDGDGKGVGFITSAWVTAPPMSHLLPTPMFSSSR